MTRPDPREVLDADELADYYAHRRMEARPMRRGGGLPRVNGDGYDQWGDYHGVPDQWDDQHWSES